MFQCHWIHFSLCLGYWIAELERRYTFLQKVGAWAIGDFKSQWVNYLQLPHFKHLQVVLQIQFTMHIRISELWPNTQLAEPMLCVPGKGQFYFQPKTPEPTLSRGHPYTSLAAGAGDFQSLIPGNFSFSNKHFRLMIKMEVGRGGNSSYYKPWGQKGLWSLWGQIS